jgi:Organic solute transporter Ostalpha
MLPLRRLHTNASVLHSSTLDSNSRTCTHHLTTVLCSVSLRVQIALHVKHYNAPELQRHVVRIICMVPIYALVSWLSLRFSSARRWLSPLRECYEAVVLYSFLCYLIGCLQRKTGDYGAWLANLQPQEPMWPFRGWLGQALGVRTISNGADFMHAMRQVRLPQAPCHACVSRISIIAEPGPQHVDNFPLSWACNALVAPMSWFSGSACMPCMFLFVVQGVLSFVFVRPILALIQVVCMLTHSWGEDQFTFRRGWLWCMLTNNATQVCCRAVAGHLVVCIETRAHQSEADPVGVQCYCEYVCSLCHHCLPCLSVQLCSMRQAA